MSDRLDQLAADINLLRLEVAEHARLANEAALFAARYFRRIAALDAELERARAEETETACRLDDLYRDRGEGA